MCGQLLSALNNVAHQERTRQRAHATRVRGDETGLVPHVLGDVTGELSADAGDADVENRGTFLDHIGSKHVCLAGRSNDDIGRTGLRGKILGAGVTQRDRGILATAGKHQTNRAAHGHAAADDDHLCTVKLHTEAAQQVDAAVWRAWQRGVLVEDQLAQVNRVQTIGVLGRVDELEHTVFIQVLRQRQLHDVAGAGIVMVELFDDALEFFLGNVARQVLANRINTEFLAIAVLHLHIRMRPWVIAHQDRG